MPTESDRPDGSDIMDAIASAVGPTPNGAAEPHGSETGSGTGGGFGSGPGSGPQPGPGYDNDSEYGRLTDAYGRHFDPAIHCTHPDGSPIINRKSGHLRVKRGLGGQTGSNSRYVPPEMAANFRSAGIAISRSFQMVCVMMGGENWKASETETQALDTAWGGYFEARGIDNIPPEVTLAIVLMGYAGPRLQASPTFRARLQQWWQRRRNTVNADFTKNGTQPDTGDNSER